MRSREDDLQRAGRRAAGAAPAPAARHRGAAARRARRGDRAGAALGAGVGRGDPQAGRGARPRSSCARPRRRPRRLARRGRQPTPRAMRRRRADGRRERRGGGRSRSRPSCASTAEREVEELREPPTTRDRRDPRAGDREVAAEIEAAKEAGRALVDEARTVRERDPRRPRSAPHRCCRPRSTSCAAGATGCSTRTAS